MAETELSMDTRALMLIRDLANDAGVGRGCHSDGYFRFRAYQAKAREILGIEESHTKKKFTPEERLRGLRNLRRGYGSTSVAVGFWQKLHGEDLIEIYAETVETKRGNSKSYPKTWSDPPTFQKVLGEDETHRDGLSPLMQRTVEKATDYLRHNARVKNWPRLQEIADLLEILAQKGGRNV